CARDQLCFIGGGSYTCRFDYW
nr:immunoglobulin heavy chain junction region [Macaca mulatta]MOX00800.1 immunoglobulin heavy chain junction region [Macaca mulatta]MOX01065.1 immunoglobulin heavy chain junction region [Macaca mulatta]MOX02041.1 immunoglobulin heavy chain junction region [Macaca mulatta]MOX06533.1 immunoglobulin heavy chain junction region [Macaca mulatta]